MIKWLPDVFPNDRAVDVAARALAGRLGAVRRYLKRAAAGAGTEDIHQLRVWARRADAALRLYADFLSPKRLKWFRKWLKRLRRAAGRVRDSDVFVRWLSGPGDAWPARLKADRRRGHRAIRRLAARLDGGRRLRRRTRKLLGRMGAEHAGTAERFADRARASIRPLADAFFAALPGDAADDAALHRFRIRGKELRYGLELLAGAFPPAFRDELYPLVGTLQEKLGLVNDLATAHRRLGEWLAATGDPATVSHLRRRQAAVGEELVRARADFRQWWTPELREGLRSRFEELLGGPLASR
jgi:CHAD domain-containing protein